MQKASGINPRKVKKLALNSQLLTVQILTNDVEMLILCLSYFVTTVQIEVTILFCVCYEISNQFEKKKLWN